MNLLLSRSQARGPRRTTFYLWAKADLLPQEQALVSKYHEVHSAVLLDGDPFKGLRPALYLALPAAALAFLFLWGNFGFGTAVVGSLVVFGGAGYLIYEHLREPVYVRDLLQGRAFKCRSITELMEKEDLLKLLAVHLRQLLEDMKNWGGKEVIAIEPRREKPAPEVATAQVEHRRVRPLSAAE